MARMAKNKALSGLLMFVLFLAVQASLAAAQGPDISLVMTKQTPYPVEPGHVVSIEVSLQNNGSGSESITLEIAPKDPFTLLPGQDIIKTFSRIDAYDSVSQSYQLKVDGLAVSAIYEIELRYYRPGSTAAIVKKVPVSVQGTPKIVMIGMKTTPESMEPGDEVEIEVVLKNEGTGKAYQTDVSLVSEPDPETEESVIVPVLSGGVFYLGKFAPGEEATAKFDLGIENDAESKNYMSTLTISYKDESGESQTTTFSVGIAVKGNPIIEVLSAKVDNSAFKVDIENIGTGNAKALKIAFVQDGEIKDSSVANELKPTKHKTIRFQGFRLGDATINISYLDEKNEFFSSEIPVTVKKSVYSEEGKGADYSSLVIVLMLVVILESYYVWRIRKRAKK